MFHELATAELARARRSRNLYALLFFDLDRFKLVNDLHGHAVGDLLLKAVTCRLREMLRDYDIVARLGGDGFVVMDSGLRSETMVTQLAEKSARELSLPYHALDGHTVETSPSIGIARYSGKSFLCTCLATDGRGRRIWCWLVATASSGGRCRAANSH